jgi:hypothetical protein
VFKYSASSPPADSVLPVSALARAGSAFDVLRNLWSSSPSSTTTAAATSGTTAATSSTTGAATAAGASGTADGATSAGTAADADADDLSLVIDEVVDSDALQEESSTAKRGAAALRGGASTAGSSSSSSSSKTARTGLSLLAWGLAAVAAAVALLTGNATTYHV